MREADSDEDAIPDDGYVMGEIVPAGAVFRGEGTLAAPEVPMRDRLAAAWLLAQKRTNTEIAYRRDIANFFGWCDEFGVDPLAARRIHLDGYRRFMEDGGSGRALSPTTITRKLSCVSSFYRYAVREAEHLVPSNPAEYVARPETTDESTTEALELPELQRLFAAADATGTWEAAMVRLLFYSAARVTELCNARTSDLRTERGHLTLAVTRKGGRRDRVVIPADAADALNLHLAGRTGPLFLGRGGRPINRDDIAYRLTKLTKAAHIDKRITPHSLRHTAATIALDGGADIREVQRMLGHKRVETTMRYDRSRTNVDRSAAHVLARVVATEAQGDL